MNHVAGAFAGILSSKLDPPAITPSQIPRAGIWRLVSTAAAARLVLMRAPAGFGKTTAMIQCRARFEEIGVDTAWLNVGDADNDAPRFLACLACAVARMTGDDLVDTRVDGTSTPASGAGTAFGIMERLAAHASPFSLFLDGFESLYEPSVLRIVREIVEHLPRGGRLVIGSRTPPDLDLGRLRARGQLLEIDANNLRFTIDETSDFFTRGRCLAIPEKDLAVLHRKTEGWIAALWLASVALERCDDRERFIARFSGSDPAVADYLAGDVLAGQPPPVRDFLLRTSILRHLSEPLCQALLPHGDSGAILRQLEAEGLFLTPVEGEERTYRYHSLFSGFLRARLARDLPEEFVRLHRVASGWYETNNRPVPAIDHAIGGMDFESAVRLLSRHAADLLEQGRMLLLTRWFDALPDEHLRGCGFLQIVRVWATCWTRGASHATELLERSGYPGATEPKAFAHLLALRPTLLSLMDRVEEALALSRAGLAQLPDGHPFAASVLANDTAYILSILGLQEESHRLLDEGRSRHSASAFHKMYAESIEGMIALEKGQLRQALSRFRIAVSSSHASSHRYTRGNAFAGVLYAAALYETNELDQAGHLLRVYLPMARDAGLADHVIVGYLMQARIASHRGDPDEALRRLTELEYIGHDRRLPRVASSAKLERARLLLMQGDREGARAELDRANDCEVWDRVRRMHFYGHDLEYFELAEFRWRIHAGHQASAISGLERAIRESTSAKRLHRALKLRILLSVAHDRQGDARCALRTMAEVLKLACDEGFVRLILDEGEHAGSIVLRLHESMRADGSGDSDPIFTAYRHKLIEGFGPALAVDAPTPTPGKPLAEPLTAKEMQILSLLAEGYSNKALAEKLFVSDSTVRTHLRNINGKLNARSRMQAVALARRIGLVR